MWYHPELSNSGKAVDVLLLKDKNFTIGLPESGVKPWEFSLRENLNGEIGYLILYLANRPINCYHLQQESPFSGLGGRAAKESSGTADDLWGVKTVIIRQIRE